MDARVKQAAFDRFLSLCAGPVRFGINDCAAAVAEAITAAGGPDLYAPWRGRYRSAAGFVRMLKGDGFKHVGAAATRRFALLGKRVGEARDLDCAVIELGGALAPAIRFDGWWHVRGHDGHVAMQATPDGIWRFV